MTYQLVYEKGYRYNQTTIPLLLQLKDDYLIMKVRHFAFNMKKKSFNAHLPESSIVVMIKSETLCARANFLCACANIFLIK